MIFSIILLLVSIFVAWAGGNFFIRGVGAFQKMFRLSGITAGLLIASISTSSPELFVGVSSAIRGLPEISLGDILGSNIANIGLILGIFLIFVSSAFTAKSIRTKDILITAGAPILVLILGADGILSKLDGVIMILIFALWVRWLIKEQHSEDEEKAKDGNFLNFVIGLGMLVVAGYTFTESAETLASAFGINLFLLSSLIVALGTSIPELATAIIAIRTKQNSVAIGNLLGSNVFNSLGILGLVALIQPISILPSILIIPVAFAVLATMSVFLLNRFSHRTVGIFLIAIYLIYITIDAFLWK